MSDDPQPTPLDAHVVPDAGAVAIALERLRGDMNTELANINATLKMSVTDVRHDTGGIIRRLDYTNSKVAEHDTALANILKRHALDDEREKLRRARWEERSRPLRLAARLLRLVLSERFVMRAGFAAVLAILGLERLGAL